MRHFDEWLNSPDGKQTRNLVGEPSNANTHFKLMLLCKIVWFHGIAEGHDRQKHRDEVIAPIIETMAKEENETLQDFVRRMEGALQDHVCPDCKGSKYFPKYNKTYFPNQSKKICVKCKGTGKIRHMTHHLENLYDQQEDRDSIPDDVKGHYSDPENPFENS